MFKYLVTLLFAVSVIKAEAKVDAGDVFVGIIGGIIIGNIIKNHNNKNDDHWDSAWQNSDKLILKDTGNKLVMASVTLPANGGWDSVRFPNCEKPSANKRVDKLLFRVDVSDVYVRTVEITYHNNDVERVPVNRGFRNQTASDWYEVARGNRCVKEIRVSGEGLITKGVSRRSVLTFVGLKSNSFTLGGSF